MSIESVRTYFQQWGREHSILEPEGSTATVELAALALGVEPARIAKSLSLRRDESAMLVVIAGDAKLDNRKFRERFGFKPRMLSAEEALAHTGHTVGGVCPFALPDTVEVYLDASLLRFQTVFPACGSPNSAIEVTPAELEKYSRCVGWVDVCKTAV